MHLLPLTYDNVLSVTRNLRAADWREAAATAWDLTPEWLAAQLSGPGTWGYVASDKAKVPTAVFAVQECWPNVLQVALVATEHFSEISQALTRHLLRSTIPSLWQSKAHRAEARSVADHHEAHAWLRLLGAKEEARLSAYGSRGEDFLVFAWLRNSPHPSTLQTIKGAKDVHFQTTETASAAAATAA